MTRYSSEILGYAVALFVCYGLFVSIGLGHAGWSLVFLLLGVTAALTVLVLDLAYADLRPSIIGVVLFCTLGFLFGWGGYQVLVWVGVRP